MDPHRCNSRRRVLRLGLAAGIGTLVSSGSFAQDARSAQPTEGDLLVRIDDPAHRPLTPDDVPLNARQLAAWAMDPMDRTVRSGSRLNALVLVRLDESALAPETRTRAAGGVVAYTAICTHNGCDVDDWIEDRLVLSCSCHGSEFDPRDAAKVVDGPAPRALPALPLKVVDGMLVVAKPFTSRVGFERG
jgi:rieske iron-sulfur protein